MLNDLIRVAPGFVIKKAYDLTEELNRKAGKGDTVIDEEIIDRAIGLYLAIRRDIIGISPLKYFNEGAISYAYLLCPDNYVERYLKEVRELKGLLEKKHSDLKYKSVQEENERDNDNPITIVEVNKKPTVRFTP